MLNAYIGNSFVPEKNKHFWKKKLYAAAYGHYGASTMLKIFISECPPLQVKIIYNLKTLN